MAVAGGIGPGGVGPGGFGPGVGPGGFGPGGTGTGVGPGQVGPGGFRPGGGGLGLGPGGFGAGMRNMNVWFKISGGFHYETVNVIVFLVVLVECHCYYCFFPQGSPLKQVRLSAAVGICI